MTTESARRKYPRIPINLEIRCANTTRPLAFVSRNLSAGGIFLESVQVFPMGAQVELGFKLPYAYGDVHLRGKVTRHHQHMETGLVDGMAIEFHEVKDIDKKMINEYIENTIDSGKTTDAQE